MTKLTDAQAILLSCAAARDSGSLLPKPATLTASADALAKSLRALVARGLAEERETSEREAVRRTDGDLGFGLFITPAGKAAIGIEDEVSNEADDCGMASTPPPMMKPERTTKATAAAAA